MSSLGKKFTKNVFINCPFDAKYTPMLRPLLFTILQLRYIPRIASESFDSGKPRVEKIYKLIEISKFSIHDLSRIKSSKTNETYRLNMAFELGVDIGCRLYKKNIRKNKRCVILETKKYRYQKALSDLSNSDIKSHNDEPNNIIREVRNWFVEVANSKAPSPTVIWQNYNEFMADFYSKRKREGYKRKDLHVMPIPEFIRFTKVWLKRKKILKK